MTSPTEQKTAGKQTLDKRISSLFKAQRFAAAMVFAEELCADAAGAFGDGHPDAIRAQTNLAVICLKVGDRARAELRLCRALEAERQRVGDQGPRCAKLIDLLKQAVGEQALASQNPQHIAELEQRVRAQNIQFACPACGRSYEGSPFIRSQRVICVDCNAEFEVLAHAAQITSPLPPPESGEPHIVMAAPLPPETPTPTPATVQNVVASDDLDYTFSLPTPGWIRMNSADEEEYGADVAVQHNNLGVIKVVVSDWALTFEDMCGGIEEAYKQEVQQYHRITSTRGVIAGLPAIYIEYEGIDPEQNQSMKLLSHAFIKEQKLYQVLAIGNPITFAALKREALAAAQSFSFDPALAEKHRGAFPQQKSSWWRRLANRPSSLPTDVQAVLAAGLKWAIGGGVVGVFFGLNAMSSVGGFFGKLLILSLWTFAGAFVGAAFNWGRIGAYVSGGHLALDKLVQIACLPFLAMEIVLSMFTPAARGFGKTITALNRAVAFPIGFVSAGCPYLIYVFLTKRTRLSAVLYIVFVLVGGVLGLMGIGLLITIGSFATPVR
jgi:hypothetical protein